MLKKLKLNGSMKTYKTFYKTKKKKKNVLFIIGDCQEIPGVASKFGLGVQNEAGPKANRVLPREHTGHNKHPLPTTQEKTLYMDNTRWSTLKSD